MDGSVGGGGAGNDAGSVDSSVGCVLTPQQAEGPFFLDTGLERSDISESKLGLDLRVRLTLTDVRACTPIEGAVVELWHADASGVYSGFDLADGNTADAARLTFLRGYQRTGADGSVEFLTIYPGWYPGRTPHLHVLALLGTDRLVTTQLYFEDALSERVYQRDPYAVRGPRDTTNAQDGVSQIGGGGTAPLLLDAGEDGEGYAGSFVIGVDVA